MKKIIKGGMDQALKSLRISWSLESKTLTVIDLKAGHASIISFHNQQKLIEIISDTDSAETREARWKTFNWFSMLTFKDYEAYYQKYGIKVLKVGLN